jgi:hypothetical protein
MQGTQTRRTPILPRPLFDTRVDAACAAADRSGVPFAVARLHLSACAEVVRIGDALAEVVRASDVAGAWSDDAFDLLLLEVDETTALRVIDRVRSHLLGVAPIARVGLACYPRDGRDRDGLVAHAGLVRPEPVAGDGRLAPPPLKGEIREMERRRILMALDHHGGNQTLAARTLGISRRTLLNRLDEFEIKRPRKPVRLNAPS